MSAVSYFEGTNMNKCLKLSDQEGHLAFRVVTQGGHNGLGM
jgi:hypothetical protein